MHPSTLPEPIAAYFAAEHNPEALGRCFTPQAVMKDDGHTYIGVEAITAFMAEASAKYSATTVPFALASEGASRSSTPRSQATSLAALSICPIAFAWNAA